MRKIGIIGSGYVGLVTGACFAEIGHDVLCVDNDERKIKILEGGGIPFYEPGLEELVKKNREAGRLRFSARTKDAVDTCEVIFICVGTPPKEGGEADLSAIERVASEIAENMTEYRLIVEKSTVPVQTGRRIKRTIELRKKKNVEYDVASNPEFLREGSAIYDFMHPDRIVIGVESERAAKILREIYEPIKAPIIETNIESAEIIKHASNSFLAMKISFINAVSIICERSGADVMKVAEGMGYDRRIGKEFLRAGIGFGGSCFPKDLSAFIKIAEKLGYEFNLLKEVEKINQEMRHLFVKKMEDLLWNLKEKKIAIFGLSFKPNTDDMRSAPSIDIINLLRKEGAYISAYDPRAMEKAKEIMPDIEYAKDPYEAATDADAIGIVTEWDEFGKLDYKRIRNLMRTPIILDGRNMLDPEEMRKLGFIYRGMGRG